MLFDEPPDGSLRHASEAADAQGFAAPKGAANALRIGRNAAGAWVVKDRLGLKAGLFRTYACALQFAKEEAAAHGLAIVAAREPLEFGSG
jgi:hypothetical protein